MDKSKFLGDIKAKIKRLDPDAEIILYGSRARGDYNDSSDWDFLILLNFAINETIKENIRNDLFEMELESDNVISSIIHSKQNWEKLKITPLYRNIKSDGILL